MIRMSYDKTVKGWVGIADTLKDGEICAVIVGSIFGIKRKHYYRKTQKRHLDICYEKKKRPWSSSASFHHKANAKLLLLCVSFTTF